MRGRFIDNSIMGAISKVKWDHTVGILGRFKEEKRRHMTAMWSNSWRVGEGMSQSKPRHLKLTDTRCKLLLHENTQQM